MPIAIISIINAVLEIIRNHQAAHPNVPLTAEMVYTDLQAQIQSGDANLVAAFAELGLPFPADDPGQPPPFVPPAAGGSLPPGA